MARRTSSGAAGSSAPAASAVGLLVALGSLIATPALSQTDYYNLDRGHPLAVEDAYAAELYVLEVQASPLALSGAPGVLFYEPSLELKYGMFPGMELSAGVIAEVTRSDGHTTGRVGEVEVSSLYNLNTETLLVPAFGVRVTGHLPIDGDSAASFELKGILTRVVAGPVRAHANGAWSFGNDVEERWWAGLALDYVLPFSSLLLIGETYYAHADAAPASDRVHSAAGLRLQLGPRTGLDFGAGRDWSGENPLDWHVTFGLTSAVGVRALMPF